MKITEEQVLIRVSVTSDRLRDWVARGWVAPVRGTEGYEYSEIDVARVDLIRQLRDDMSVEPDAVSIVLSMMDQVYTLRRELRCLMRALDTQPKAIKEEVLIELKRIRGPGQEPDDTAA